MAMYRVTWEIDIDAETPRKAAQKALEIHRNPESIATVFEVQPHGGRGRAYSIDLLPGGDTYPIRSRSLDHTINVRAVPRG